MSLDTFTPVTRARRIKIDDLLTTDLILFAQLVNTVLVRALDGMELDVPARHHDGQPDDSPELSQAPSVPPLADSEEAFPATAEVLDQDPIPGQDAIFLFLVVGQIPALPPFVWEGGHDVRPSDVKGTQITRDEILSVDPFLVTLGKESHEARVIKDRFVVRAPPDRV
jgi:hypothetical protein